MTNYNAQFFKPEDEATTSYRRRNVIRAAKAVVGLGIVSGLITWSVISNNEQNTATTNKINKAVHEDGFTTTHGAGETGIDSLVLRNCTFKNVDIKTTDKRDSGFDITSYSMAVGTLQPGSKFEEDSVRITFSNAAQLQAELPGLKC